MPSARAFRRMLMSFDTSTTSRCGYFSCSARTTPRIWLSALPMGRSEGRVLWIAVVWNIRRPVASLLPSADSSRPSSSCLASCTSASSERLTWRALRAAGHALLLVVQLFQRHHRQEDVVLFKAEQRAGIVQQHVGVQHEQLARRVLRARLGALAGAGAALTGRSARAAGAAGRAAAPGGRARESGTYRGRPGRPCRPARAGPAGRRRPRQERLACWTAQRSWCCGPAPGRSRPREGQDSCGAGRQLRKRHMSHSPVWAGWLWRLTGLARTANRCFWRLAGLPWRGGTFTPRHSCTSTP